MSDNKSVGLYDVSFVSSSGTRLSVCEELPLVNISGLTDDEKYIAAFEAFVTLDTEGKFVEIGNITDGGSLGGETATSSQSKLRDGKPQKWVGETDPGTQTVAMGNTISDPGQRMLKRIRRTKDKKGAFKIDMPDGRIGYYVAIVKGQPNDIGSASDYLSSTVNLDIVDEIYWSDEYEELLS